MPGKTGCYWPSGANIFNTLGLLEIALQKAITKSFFRLYKVWEHVIQKGDRQREKQTYFLGSERSIDSFLVFANCNMAGGARLCVDNDWTEPGSVYECGMPLETPATLKLEVTYWIQIAAPVPAFCKSFPPETRAFSPLLEWASEKRSWLFNK